MSEKQLESKIKAIRELQALIEEAQAEQETLKDEIKAHMGASEALRAGEYRITYKSVSSLRVDTAALKKAMPDVAAAFSKEITTRRFCIA